MLVFKYQAKAKQGIPFWLPEGKCWQFCIDRERVSSSLCRRRLKWWWSSSRRRAWTREKTLNSYQCPSEHLRRRLSSELNRFTLLNQHSRKLQGEDQIWKASYRRGYNWSPTFRYKRFILFNWRPRRRNQFKFLRDSWQFEHWKSLYRFLLKARLCVLFLEE